MSVRIATLRFIDDQTFLNGYPPSQDELRKWMGCSGIRSAQHRLEMLQDMGWLDKVPGTARGIRLTEAGYTALATERPQ